MECDGGRCDDDGLCETHLEEVLDLECLRSYLRGESVQVASAIPVLLAGKPQSQPCCLIGKPGDEPHPGRIHGRPADAWANR